MPAELAVYTPTDWDNRELTEIEAATYRDGFPPDEEAWERLRQGRWLGARAAWAQENAPGAWPYLLAEFLGFPA
jgi:hypothetical protein